MTDVLEQPAGRASGLLDELSTNTSIARNSLFAGLVFIAFANGITENIAQEIGDRGFVWAVFETFGISIFVWAALVAGLVLLRRASFTRTSSLDFVVAGFATAAVLLPVPSLSWLAISAMALYLIIWSAGSEPFRRAGGILLAMTVPMFWSRVLMGVFGDWVLAVDASMVAWLVGTKRNGNVVPFADGSGAMFIAPSCSSLSNVSLAILCSVIFVNLTSGRWSPGKIMIVLGACLAVVAINVTRIGLIGFYPGHFDLIHGDVGATLAGGLETAAILGICYYGFKRRAPASP